MISRKICRRIGKKLSDINPPVNFRFAINGEPVTASVPDSASTLALLGLAVSALVCLERRSRCCRG